MEFNPRMARRFQELENGPRVHLVLEKAYIDKIEEVDQSEAEEMSRDLAKFEGIFCGPSAAGAFVVAKRISSVTENAELFLSFVIEAIDIYQQIFSQIKN